MGCQEIVETSQKGENSRGFLMISHVDRLRLRASGLNVNLVMRPSPG